MVRAPVEAQPADIFLDGLDIFHVFGSGIGVIVTEVALSAKFAGQAEIQADGLGVTDVQVTVGFGRKTGDDLALALSGGPVGVDDLPDKMAGRSIVGVRLGCIAHTWPSFVA